MRSSNHVTHGFFQCKTYLLYFPILKFYSFQIRLLTVLSNLPLAMTVLIAATGIAGPPFRPISRHARGPGHSGQTGRQNVPTSPESARTGPA
jgi:hypothetical protein